MPECLRDRGLPPRIAARPDPSQWGEDELLTLREAASLLWPDGPLTERSLRTAARDGRLPVTMIARKLLTTRRALREMSQCEPRTPPPVSAAPRTDARGDGVRPDREAAYRRLMRAVGKAGDPP